MKLQERQSVPVAPLENKVTLGDLEKTTSS